MENQIQEEISKIEKKQKSPFMRYFLFWLFLFSVMFGIYRYGYSQGKIGKEEGASVFTSFSLKNNSSCKEPSDFDADFFLFWNAWETLEEKFVDTGKINDQDILYGAIEGMFHATKDPYTTFFDPEENKEFDESISGEFEGIGAELEKKNDFLTVVAPLKGSPADRSGLRPGDIIVAVGGEDITRLSVVESVSKIRGAKGTEVVLTIAREGASDTFDVSIIRETIQIESVVLEMRDTVAIVEVRQFGEKTLREFREAISQARAQQMQSLVIDLRNNPGGYLSTAVEMASMMIQPGSVVVIEENGSGNRKELRSSKMPETENLLKIPTVVLINKGSASASEILSGALKYHREDITILGEKSFGKGSVQELVPLPQKTAAKITVAKWLTPSGEHIDKEGIAPEVEVSMTEEDYKEDRDPQLDKALEILTSL